jgi:hypothetical protein
MFRSKPEGLLEMSHFSKEQFLSDSFENDHSTNEELKKHRDIPGSKKIKILKKIQELSELTLTLKN